MGFNESFHGPEGLARFRDELAAFINHTQRKAYNGKKAPQLVLATPIAMEQHPDYHLPSAHLRNTDLNRYATAIKEIASLKSVGLIDLYQPTLTMFGGADSPHTFNGVHLNDQGYAALAPILMSTLSGKATSADVNPLLTEAILDKSWFWRNDYRGRLWVSTVPSYPHYKPGGERPNDKLLIYEDTDGDGRADKETVFADGLHVPIGFELAPEGVYISEEPYLTIHKDTDGDARADTCENGVLLVPEQTVRVLVFIKLAH